MTSKERKMGSRLCQIMYEKKISQTDVAKACGVDNSTVHHWMAGHGMATLSRLTRALKFLGASPDDLVKI